MEKGNIKLHDFLAVMPPIARIKILDEEQKVMYEGQKAGLIKSDPTNLLNAYEVKHFNAIITNIEKVKNTTERIIFEIYVY